MESRFPTEDVTTVAIACFTAEEYARISLVIGERPGLLATLSIWGPVYDAGDLNDTGSFTWTLGPRQL
jgi:hypothetical protein